MAGLEAVGDVAVEDDGALLGVAAADDLNILVCLLTYVNLVFSDQMHKRP